MLSFLRQQWFIAGLFVLIPLGMLLGWLGLEETIPVLQQVHVVNAYLTPVVLYLMSVTLDSGKMWAAIRAPGPVLWASTVNMGLIPLLAWPLLGWQRHPDLSVGLMVAASVPCTMAAASVWTRKAAGNDAISLLVTVLTSSVCFLVTPAWLKWGVGATVKLDTLELMQRLLLSALVPIVLGQVTRLVSALKLFADKHKLLLGSTAQCLILLNVFIAAFRQGPQLRATSTVPTLMSGLAVACLSVIAVHLAALWIAHVGGRWLRFAADDVIAITFAGSQKTLPIGIYVATELLTDVPFAVYPMLMYHALQLVIDTLLLERLSQWRQVQQLKSGK